MADFDFTGADNTPDAGGDGELPAPPPSSIPSVAGASAGPVPISPAQADPRLAAVLQRLQPQQQPASPWVEAIRKIVPMLGVLAAIHENAGGAFAQAWENGEKQKQLQADQKAQEDLRLATILHQQEQERAAARTAKLAQERIDAAAKKEQEGKQRTLELNRYNDLAKGPVFEHANEIASTQGKDAVDQYLSQYEGLGGTLKDLVDKYGIRDSKTGAIALGQVKSPKEVKAGTLEDWVSNAERIDAANRGRDLTDVERQAVDAVAIKAYKNISKDPADQEIAEKMKRLQLDLEGLKVKQLQGTIDDINAAKKGIEPGTKEYGLARDLAYGIISYPDFARMYAFQRAGREQMRNIYATAREINPDFSPTLFEQGAKFAGAPQTKRSLAAVANVKSGLPSMLEASDAATRSNVKALNEHFIIPGGVQIGEHEYSDLAAAHKAFADELSLALGVGTASDLKTKLGLDLADPNLSPEAFRSVLQNQLLPFLNRREQSLKQQMGPYGFATGARDLLPTPQNVPGMNGVQGQVH